jgi:hypothetical protein
VNKTELNRTVQPMGLVVFYQMTESFGLELMCGCTCVSNGFKLVKVCNFRYIGHVMSHGICSILSKYVLLKPKNEVDAINQYNGVNLSFKWHNEVRNDWHNDLRNIHQERFSSTVWVLPKAGRFCTTVVLKN